MNENSDVFIPSYEKLLDGTPSEKIEIARLFKANMNEERSLWTKERKLIENFTLNGTK